MAHRVSLAWVCLAALCGAPQAASAEEAVVRWSQVVAGLPGASVDVAVSMTPGRPEPLLRVTLGADERARMNLPPWSGLPHYTYKVEVGSLGGGSHAVLFEAMPSGEGGPEDSATLQVLWIVEAREWRSKPWVVQSVAQHTELDGGDLISLQAPSKRGESHVLRRMRTRPSLRFCGARDASREEVFLLGSRGFAPQLSVDDLLRDAKPIPALVPARPVEAPLLPNYFRWQSASSGPGKPPGASAGGIIPRELGDGDLSTSWLEGGEGYGRGEFATAHVEDVLELRAVRIFAGPGRSAQLAQRSPRPRRVLLGFSDGSRAVVELARVSFEELVRRGGLIVELPAPVRTSCISVMLLESDPPPQRPPRKAEFTRRRDLREAKDIYSSAALSEVTPLSIIDGQTPELAARMIVARMALEVDIKRNERLALLAQPLARFIVPALEERLARGEAIEQRRLLPLLSYMPAELAAPLLSKMFQETPPDAPAYRSIKRALVQHSRSLTPTLVKMLDELPKDDTIRRVDLMRLYGRIAQPDEARVFIEQLGQGATPVRQERVRLIARGGPALIEPLSTFAAAHIDEEAGRDALDTLALIARRMETLGVSHPERSVALLDAMERVKQRRSALMLMRAVGLLRTSGASAPLASWLASEREPMVRAAAATALRTQPGDAARETLQQALLDDSPDVRIAAAHALDLRSDVALAHAALLDYVQRERWPEGLEVAIAALLKHPSPQAQQVLDAMLLSKEEPARVRVIATSFARARHAVGTPAAKELLERRALGSTTRRSLIISLGYGADAAGEQLLVRLSAPDAFLDFEEMHRAQELQRQALVALGRRRSANARTHLLKTLDDTSRDLAARRAAARSLAFFNEAELLAALQARRASAEPALHEALDQAIGIMQGRADIDRILEVD